MQSCQVLIWKSVTLEFFHCTVSFTKKLKELQFQARLAAIKKPLLAQPAAGGS